jgi:hypothetical protein
MISAFTIIGDIAAWTALTALIGAVAVLLYAVIR